MEPVEDPLDVYDPPTDPDRPRNLRRRTTLTPSTGGGNKRYSGGGLVKGMGAAIKGGKYSC